MMQYNVKEILAYIQIGLSFLNFTLTLSFISMHNVCNSSTDANCQELQAVHAILQQIIRKSRNEIAYSTFQYIYIFVVDDSSSIIKSECRLINKPKGHFRH